MSKKKKKSIEDRLLDKMDEELVAIPVLYRTSHIWKPIVFGNITTDFEVNILGEIRKQGSDKIYRHYLDKDGYHGIGLTFNHIRYNKRVHRLVAEAFIPNPDFKPQVNHIDGDKNNNCVWNLEWVTAKENIHHSITTGLADPKKPKFFTEAAIRKACELLQEGYSVREASLISEISVDTINQLRIGLAWPQIAKEYDFSKSYKRNYTDNKTRLAIANLVLEGRYAPIEILQKLGLPTTQPYQCIVQNIKRKILVGKSPLLEKHYNGTY